MKRIGAHVSIAGGVQNAVTNAVELGATAIGMFTRNQRMWNQRPLSEEDAATFRDALREHGFAPEHVLPHDSYLINLGSSAPEVVAKSRDRVPGRNEPLPDARAPLPELPPGRSEAGRWRCRPSAASSRSRATSTRRWSRPRA